MFLPKDLGGIAYLSGQLKKKALQDNPERGHLGRQAVVCRHCAAALRSAFVSSA